MPAEAEEPPPPRRARARPEDPPPDEPDKHAGLTESLPLWCATALFGIMGVVAQVRGLTLGPGHIHLSILLYALAAMAAIGALLAWRSADVEPPDEAPPAAPARPRYDERGRPTPAVTRAPVTVPVAAPGSEDSEPSPATGRGSGVPRHGRSEEVHSALREIDAIQDELDDPPAPRRARRSSDG